MVLKQNPLAHLAIGTRPDLLIDAMTGANNVSFEYPSDEAATAAQQQSQPVTDDGSEEGSGGSSDAPSATVCRGAIMRLGGVRDPLLLRTLTRAVLDGSSLNAVYSPYGVRPAALKLTGACRVTSLFTVRAPSVPADYESFVLPDDDGCMRTDALILTFVDGLTLERH